MIATSLPSLAYAKPWPIIADAIKGLAPPIRRSVSACALEHRVLANPGGGYSGQWSFDLAPYLRAPMDALSDGRHHLVVVMGCSQSGKTECALNWLAHTVIDDPANMIWVMPTKDLMRDIAKTRIAPMIAASPAMRERLRDDLGADNIFSKAFRGMTFWAAWPSPSELRSRPAPRWCVDDADELPDDIGGQGDIEMLLGARQTTFEGSEIGLKISSPARGDNKGIHADWLRGSRETWRWPCPHCGAWFSPDFDQLTYDKGTPEEAAESAVLV